LSNMILIKSIFYLQIASGNNKHLLFSLQYKCHVTNEDSQVRLTVIKLLYKPDFTLSLN
jgi:hypothetical protein